MPELRIVVLALQDKLSCGTTFQAALSSLFGEEVSSLNAIEAPQAAATASQRKLEPSSDINALISEAGRDFADYQRLTAEAGLKLDALNGVLERPNAYKK
jgi:hypothetical protein